MLNFIKRQLDFKLIQTAFVFALIYCLLFNSSVFIYKFSYFKSDILLAIFDLAKDFIYLLLVLFIIFFGLTIHRVVFFVGAIFLFITGAIVSYYLFFFSIAPTAAIMPSIFGTHATELQELVSVRITVWIIFSLLVCLYSIKHFQVQTTKSFVTRLLSAVCLLIVISNIIKPQYTFVKSYFPMQYLHNSYTYFFGSSSKFTREDIARKYEFVDSSDEDIIGVFVIGESARYDKFGINGYDRDTTPNLSKIDLVSYKATACANATYLAVPCMLSRFGKQDLDLVDTETSILSALTSLDFNTIWLGTQSVAKYYRNRVGGSFYDEVKFHTIPGGSLVFLPNDYDGKMLPYIEQNIADKGKKFLVLHSTGSHWNYSARHPKEFTKFTPAIDATAGYDACSCGAEELVNSYDNSILYTDFFLSSVIELLKDKKAFFIYVSDHGESLGENGMLSHGNDGETKEQFEVPFIVWASDSYRKQYPEKWNAIIAAKNRNISQDNIFHSILDCLNIESNSVDKSLSVCQPNL